MTQQQGAERRHFGPSWPEVGGFGTRLQQAFSSAGKPPELLAVLRNNNITAFLI